MISTVSRNMSFRMFPPSFMRQLYCSRLNSVLLPLGCYKGGSTLPDMCESLLSDLMRSTVVISILSTTLLRLRLYEKLQVQCVWMPWSNFNGMQKKCHILRTCGLPCALGTFKGHAKLDGGYELINPAMI